MTKKTFISFSGSIDSDGTDLVNRQKLLNATASKYANIDEVIAWTREDILHTDFYKKNQEILDNPRGAGYWAWKPYIILETLKKSGKDDWVIYCDVGKPFRKGDDIRSGNNNIGNTFFTPVDVLLEYAKQNKGFTPGVWIPHYGLAHIWTKRDCFVGMDCDSSIYHNSPHVQAGYSAWSNSDASIAFLEEWLRWCQEPSIITDNKNIHGKPNLEHFRDHRHDQSILTNLCVKHDITLFGPKDRSLNGYRNFNLIIKHMMLSRSHQQEQQLFSRLFSGKNPELPSFLQEILALLFLTELTQKSPKPNILLHADLDVLTWQRALPDVSIDLFNEASQRQKQDKKYEGIFITKANPHQLNKRIFSELYSALEPGSLLLFGSYPGHKNDEPLIDGTFSQFIAWLHRYQRLPEGFGDISDQRPNALTSGSIVNPLISYFNNDTSCFATLVKPKMYLLDQA